MIFLPYVYVLETQEHRLGLAGLLVVPCLGLVWPGPVLPALPTLPLTTAATTPGCLRRKIMQNHEIWHEPGSGVSVRAEKLSE